MKRANIKLFLTQNYCIFITRAYNEKLRNLGKIKFEKFIWKGNVLVVEFLDRICEEELCLRLGGQERLGWARKFVNISPALLSIIFGVLPLRVLHYKPQVLIAFKQDIKLNSFPSVRPVVFDRETSTSLDAIQGMSQLKAVFMSLQLFLWTKIAEKREANGRCLMSWH